MCIYICIYYIHIICALINACVLFVTSTAMYDMCNNVRTNYCMHNTLICLAATDILQSGTPCIIYQIPSTHT